MRRPRRGGRRPKLVAQCPQDSTLCLSSGSSGSRVPEIWDWNWQHLATLGSNPPVECRRPIPHLRYFDWQAGARLDLDSGPTRSWAAIGIEGLAPYFFNFAPTLHVRDEGRVAGRIEGSYDLYLTQRLILQPQIELNFYSQADPGRGIGTGFSDLDGGVRLGYQFSRKFAPYIGYTYTGAFGQAATFSRQAGQPTSAPRLAFGVWVWH